jgi:hypothetical protein
MASLAEGRGLRRVKLLQVTRYALLHTSLFICSLATFEAVLSMSIYKHRLRKTFVYRNRDLQPFNQPKRHPIARGNRAQAAEKCNNLTRKTLAANAVDDADIRRDARQRKGS